jgi:hypothetical protein
VGDDDDGAAVVGQAPQGVHDRLVEPGVEARGGFVEEEQRGAGEQFEGDAGALALAAGERVDALLGLPDEPQLADHLVDAAVPVGRRHVGGEPQPRRVGQRPSHGELGVEDVVLRHQADALAQLVVVGVEIAPRVLDDALVGGPEPGEGPQQRRLPGAGRADDGQQAAPAEREADAVQQRLVALAHDEPVGPEADVAGVDVLDEPVTLEVEQRVPDADHRRRPHRCPSHPRAVDERAVGAAEVDDVPPAVGAAHELGVVARDEQVGDDDVVVLRAADPQAGDRGGTRAAVRGGREVVHRREPALRRRPLDGRDGDGRVRTAGRSRRGGWRRRRGDVHLRPGLRVAEADGDRPRHGQFAERAPAGERAVAAAVHEHPTVGRGVDQQVLAGHARPEDLHVGGLVTADPQGPARRHRAAQVPGPDLEGPAGACAVGVRPGGGAGVGSHQGTSRKAMRPWVSIPTTAPPAA